MLSNCVFSLWDLYGKYLIAFIGFFLVQTLLIVSLLMQKRRSRLAEEALKGRLLHLEDLVRERTEVLDNQREWLQITLTSIGDAVIATDMKGRITFINPVAAELTGWREDEALGRTIEEVFPVINEQTRKPAEDITRRVLRDGHVAALANHTALISRDGREIPIEDSAAPIRDRDGNLIGVVLVFHDVTTERKAQMALRESEGLLRLFVEHAPASLAMFDREMRYLGVSRRWINDYNLGERDLSGISYYEVFPEIPESWKEVHRRGLAGEVVREDADRFVRAGGSVHWLRWEVRPWYDAAGDVAGIVIFSEDITEIKKQEEELRHLNQTMRALSNANQAAMRAGNVSDFLDEVCRIIVEDCGRPMVWIGFAENDENKTVKPVAQAGFEEGYLETIKITWSDTELGRGPTGIAIRTGSPDVCRNMLTESRMRPWREQAIKRGYASSVALPMKAGGQTLGALTIYSRDPDSISNNEVKLLAELADDVAYGITVLRLRLAHQEFEKKLREGQARLDLALRSAHMGVWDLDLIEGKRHFDDQVCHLLGINRAEFAGTAEEFYQAVHPEDRQMLKAQLHGSVEGDAPYETEYRAVWPDGSIHHMAARGKALLGDDGRPIMVNGILWDITGRKLAEEELVRAKEEWERTFDSVPDLIAVLDTEHRIVRVNREMAQRLGVTPEQCVGLRCYEAVHGLTGPPEFCPHTLTLRDRREHIAEVHEQRLGGDFLVSTTPLRNERGVLVGTVHVARDITERKHMEEDLLRSRDELEIRVKERTAELQMTNRALKDYAVKLERLNEELRDFAFIASHDLQEPVRKIQAFGDMLERKSGAHLDEGGQDCVMRMARSAKQMGALIQSLLEYSRLSTRLGPRSELTFSALFRKSLKKLSRL